MIEIRLCGVAIEHPASIVLPLLVSDLPVFCRWRGEPEWGSSQLAELARRRRPARRRLVGVAWSPGALRTAGRALRPRRRLRHRLFPDACLAGEAGRALAGDRRVERLGVEGPKADALLLAGWLRSRLRARDCALVAWCRGGAGGPRRREADRRRRSAGSTAAATCSLASWTASAATRSTRRAVRAQSSCDRCCATRRSASSSRSCRRPFDEIALRTVDPGGDRRVAEPPAGLLDDDLRCREVPDGYADRVDGAVDCALGDEHVRPEVAEATGVPAAAREVGKLVLEARRRSRRPRRARPSRRGCVAVGERAPRRARPTSGARARAPRRPRAERRHPPRARSASPRRVRRASSFGSRRWGR